ADEKTMLSSKPRYPSSVVRLELLAQIVETLGMSRQDALGNLQPKALIHGSPIIERDIDLRHVASSDFTIIPFCVNAVTTTPLLDGYRFKDLYNWNVTDFSPYGSVDNWKQVLLASGRLYPEKRLESPRMVISGAVAAWTSICTITDAMQRKESYLQLANRLLPVLKDSREEGVRGISRTAEPDTIGLGNQVAQWILETRIASLDSIEM